jgi:hypothetical protein
MRRATWRSEPAHRPLRQFVDDDFRRKQLEHEWGSASAGLASPTHTPMAKGNAAQFMSHY